MVNVEYTLDSAVTSDGLEYGGQLGQDRYKLPKSLVTATLDIFL